MDIKPNPGCGSQLCRAQQSAYLKKYNSAEAVSARQAAQEKERQEAQPASHADNEWKIEVVPEEERSPAPGAVAQNHGTQMPAEGLQFELPVSKSTYARACCP